MSISTICEIIVAIGTWGLVYWTFKLTRSTTELVTSQNEVAKTNLVASLQLKMEDRFDSNSMVTARSKLARQLLTNAPHDEIQEDVMNFFESVGTMFRRGYLDPEMTWAAFSFYAIHWWAACKEYIDTERKRQDDDHTIFDDFQNLVDKLCEIESSKRKLSRSQLEPRTQKIQQFLQDESGLLGEE
jgi:hypothetical protein